MIATVDAADAAVVETRPIVTADRVVKHFGKTVALDGVSLEVRPGELLGMLGPNGAGKTTLLDLIAGLRRPDAGTVTIFGGTPTDPKHRELLGTTPQQTALPETLRVREVLDYVAAHYVSPGDREVLVDEFDLGSLLNKMCGGLSGGQQRRVAVALAFVGDPQLVLLDEPTTGLDLDARAMLWQAIRSRHASGCSVVVTSHHLDEIEALAQRVVVVSDGVVLSDGTLAETLRRVSMGRVTLHGVDAAEIEQLAPGARVETVADSDQLNVYTADADALIRSLVTNRLPFSNLAVRGASLEEAFLAITKG